MKNRRWKCCKLIGDIHSHKLEREGGGREHAWMRLMRGREGREPWEINSVVAVRSTDLISRWRNPGQICCFAYQTSHVVVAHRVARAEKSC